MNVETGMETALNIIDKEPYYLATGNEIRMFQAALPVMLKGPTGCGKTRFVEYMAP